MAKRSFPTKTLWNIMEPVSQQAAQLVILHDEACAGRSLPDLTAPVQGVVSAVENLLHVCSSLLASSCDQTLLSEMPAACHAADLAAKGLLEAAEALLASPASDTARRLLATNIHALLSAMVALLFAWDDSEVRLAVSACQTLLDYVADNLRLVVNEENLRAFLTSVTASLTSLLRRVRARADDLICGQRSSALLRACRRLEELWRRLSVSLTAHVAACADAESSQQVCRTREQLCGALLAQGHEIISLLLGADEKDTLRTSTQQLEHDRALVQQRKGQVQEWLTSCGPGQESRPVWEVVRAARRLGHLSGTVGEQEELLLGLADEVERLLCRHVLGLDAGEDEFKAALAQKLNALMTACEEVRGGKEGQEKGLEDDRELLDAVQQQLCGGGGRKALEEMLEALRDTTLGVEERRDRFEKARERFAVASKAMAVTAERLAVSVSRDDIKDRRLETADLQELRDLTLTLGLESELVQESSRRLLNSPEKAKEDKELTESSESWLKCAKQIQEIAQKAGGLELMKVVEEATEKSAKEAVAEAKKGDSAAGLSRVTQVADLAQWAVDAAKVGAEQHEDQALTDRVNEAIKNSKFSVDGLTAAGRQMVDQRGDASSVQRWRQEADGALATMADLRQTLKAPKAAAPTGAAPAADGGMVEEPQFDFPAPLADQAIMKAAHQLHAEANHWESAGNSLVAAAKRAAILLGQLHAAAQTDGGNKKALIQTARALHAETTQIVKEAKKLAQACTDKRMKAALLDLCTRLTTQNQQLKVVTAVKAAATGAHDTGVESDAYEALSTNAEILMRGVVDTLKLAEAASIKIRVDSGLVLCWVRRG